MESFQGQNKSEIVPKYSIIAMGQTGAGKSTVLNSLALGVHQQGQKVFQEGGQFYSETQSCMTIVTNFKRRQNAPLIQVMDVPGFMDTQDNDLENLVKLCDALQQLKYGISVILFCLPVTRIRLSQDIQLAFKWLGIILGKGVYKYVKICLTQSDTLNESEKFNVHSKYKTQLLPALKQLTGIDIDQQIIIYNYGQENDGLDELLQNLQQQNQTPYVPEINQIIQKEFDRNDPYGSVEKILKMSDQFQNFQKELQNEREKKEENERKLEDLMVKQQQITQENMEEKRQLRLQQEQERQRNQEEILKRKIENQNILKLKQEEFKAKSKQLEQQKQQMKFQCQKLEQQLEQQKQQKITQIQKEKEQQLQNLKNQQNDKNQQKNQISIPKQNYNNCESLSQQTQFQKSFQQTNSNISQQQIQNKNVYNQNEFTDYQFQQELQQSKTGIQSFDQSTSQDLYKWNQNDYDINQQQFQFQNQNQSQIIQYYENKIQQESQKYQQQIQEI